MRTFCAKESVLSRLSQLLRCTDLQPISRDGWKDSLLREQKKSKDSSHVEQFSDQLGNTSSSDRHKTTFPAALRVLCSSPSSPVALKRATLAFQLINPRRGRNTRCRTSALAPSTPLPERQYGG